MTEATEAQAGYITCNECSGTSGNVRTWDRVRGIMVNGWCIRCDGDGRVYVGQKAALVAILEQGETQ